MTKKNFIALADMVIRANTDPTHAERTPYFSRAQIEMLADFCESQNPEFNRARWLGYIAATNGRNGGKVKGNR